jgi:hypothetical protein
MTFCFSSECELELICKLGSELVFKRGESCWRWDRRVCGVLRRDLFSKKKVYVGVA